ncbi:Protein of unknown function [Gryllus bimaculatus]|nr:Protein of unknown function [Gryllus bimaculatus]
MESVTTSAQKSSTASVAAAYMLEERESSGQCWLSKPHFHPGLASLRGGRALTGVLSAVLDGLDDERAVLGEALDHLRREDALALLVLQHRVQRVRVQQHRVVQNKT